MIAFSASNIMLLTPQIGIILLIIVGAWIIAARALSRRFNELSAQKEAAAATTNANSVEEKPSRAPAGVN
jgi:ATP/ADP translocase